MPALCVFADLQSTSLLLYKSPLEYWFKTFPYVYSVPVFSSSFTQDAFYRALFDAFCQQNKIKLEKCDLLLMGLLEAPKLQSLPVKYSASLHEVLKSIQNYYPLFVSNSFVCNSESCYSTHSSIVKKSPPEPKDSEEENYYANMEIYPQLVTPEISVQVDIDRNIASLLDSSIKFPKDMPVVFCGSRFSQNAVSSELDYLLLLNLVKSGGIYDVRIDKNNALILTTLLKMFDPKTELENEIEKEATLIVSANSLECMVKTDVDTSQLVQLDRDRILVLPMAREERVQIMVKSHDLGLVEKAIGGGRIGIIFDTRVSKDIRPEDMKVFSSGLRAFKEVLGV